MGKKEYDLICSLGGSCASAYQMKARKMRIASLPFDWLFGVDDSILSNLIKCFENDFKNWFLKENLVELTDEERGNSSFYQYKDTVTGFRFIHDFHKPLDENGEYEKNKLKYDKRIKRLYNYLQKAQRICFLFDTTFPVQIEKVKDLQRIIEDKFGKKEVLDFVLCEFNAENQEDIVEDNISIHKFNYDKHLYNFYAETREFSFLDEMGVSEKLTRTLLNNNLISIRKIKKGIKIHLLSKVSTVFRIRVYILGLRFDFCIGKERD